MNTWQLTMAVGLTFSTVVALAIWWRTFRLTRFALPFMAPAARLLVQHGYAVALIPLSEAWVLWMGGFWR